MKLIPMGKKGTRMRGVIHVVIPDSWDLAMTFLRMQEWYESPNPKFARKHFTLEEYMRWYQKAYGNGAFTYPKDWTGFNVPSTAVLAIMNGPITKGPDHPQWQGPKYPCRNGAWEQTWSKAEERLFDALVDRGTVEAPDPCRKGGDWDQYRAEPFYLIGTTGLSDWALKHEVAHGAYYIFPDRRKAINDAIKRHNVQPLVEWMMKKGYSKWTLLDEVHAYTLTGFPDNFKPTKDLLALKRELKRITGE